MNAPVSIEKSTTGRTYNWLRPALGVASWLSPELAGSVASRWFFRTEKSALRSNEREALARGRRRRVGFRGGALETWSFGQGPGVLLVHGWNGRGAQLAPLALALADAGHTAIVFDAPGHGESPGDATTIPEMARAARAVADAYAGVDLAVTHSLGGVAVAFALSEGWQLDGVAMIAPPISPRYWVDRFAQSLGLDADAQASMRRAIERHAGASFERIEPLGHAPFAHADLLVIHDAGDREVPFSAGRALAEAWPNAELFQTEGLGHRRILGDARVISEVVEFVSRPRETERRELPLNLGAELS